MARRGRDANADVAYTSDLGRSTMTSLVLDSLVDEGKLEDRSMVRPPGFETVPAPRDDEAIIFVRFSTQAFGFHALIWCLRCCDYME